MLRYLLIEKVKGCSERSSSSFVKKASTGLKAVLKEHDEDSLITESFLLMIRQAPRHKPSPSHIAPVVQASSTDENERPSKKTKVLVSKAPSNTNPSLPAMIAPRKETPTAAAPRKVAPPKVPREEVSNKHLDKVVS
ncbi:hypothetical protein BHM03_00039122 [Ensete ventricosum]|nr:hypothetical protein BHM03_00039122 [Ensete ventricosum]